MNRKNPRKKSNKKKQQLSKSQLNGRARRNKGNNYERKIVKELRELGYTEAITSRYASKFMDDRGVDILGVDDFHIQCKAVEANINTIDVLDIMPRDKVPVIFHKKNRRAETVTMYKEDFVKLLLKKGD